jgi:7,8-dihydropterin-6-yl-methyl-4-(beta-D-ribofuranosyl)aminobenzene 5'-phosphate synthase
VHPDPLEDDLALWLRTPRGLVVILGCGHAGLINTLTCARRLSGGERLHAVLGGFHLGGASESRLLRTAAALRTLEPDLVVPCHCTGAQAIARFREALGERVVPGAAGMRFRLGIPAA